MSEPRKNRGRPPDPAKRAAILAAARSIFLAGGPQRLSIEAIAREAGVSKVTIYSHFTDLPGLMRSVVLAQMSQMMVFMDELPGDRQELRIALVEFGLRLMTFLTGDEYLAMIRVMVSQTEQQPWLAPLIYQEGAEMTCDKLADLLAEAARRGDLGPHDSRRAAEQLLGMWQGIQTTGLVMGGCPPPDAETLRERIECAVDLILRACGPAC